MAAMSDLGEPDDGASCPLYYPPYVYNPDTLDPDLPFPYNVTEDREGVIPKSQRIQRDPTIKEDPTYIPNAAFLPAQRTSNPSSHRVWRGEYCKLRAAEFTKRKLYAEAQIMLREAVSREPYDAKAWVALGANYMQSGENWEKSCEAISRALELMPEYANGWYNRALARQQYCIKQVAIHGQANARVQGLLKESVADYTRCVAIDKYCGQAYHNRAACWGLLKEGNRAIADLRKANLVMNKDSPLHAMLQEVIETPPAAAAAAEEAESAQVPNASGKEAANEEDMLWADAEEEDGPRAARAGETVFERSRRLRFQRLRDSATGAEGRQQLCTVLRMRAKALKQMCHEGGDAALAEAEELEAELVALAQAHQADMDRQTKKASEEGGGRLTKKRAGKADVTDTTKGRKK